jgi:hypothetical protein
MHFERNTNLMQTAVAKCALRLYKIGYQIIAEKHIMCIRNIF